MDKSKIIPFPQCETASNGDLFVSKDELTIPDFPYQSFIEHVNALSFEEFKKEMSEMPQSEAIVLIHNLALYNCDVAQNMNIVFRSFNVFETPLFCIMHEYIEAKRHIVPSI